MAEQPPETPKPKPTKITQVSFGPVTCAKCSKIYVPGGGCPGCAIIRSRNYRKIDPDRARRIGRICTRKWRAAHPEKVKAANLRSYSRHRQWARKNKPKITVYNRRYSQKVSGIAQKRYRQKHKQLCNMRCNNWKRKHPLKQREYSRRRYLRCGVNKVDYAVVLALYGMVCHVCKKPIRTRKNLHFDHVVPLCRGGSHSQENIKPSHAKCNHTKNKRLMSELQLK